MKSPSPGKSERRSAKIKLWDEAHNGVAKRDISLGRGISHLISLDRRRFKEKGGNRRLAKGKIIQPKKQRRKV